ncbi:hypothetical protein CVT24_011806 [Panaeolus cyanescens]|uniref:Uncharacterized protein n=1 Tax=Panaeolus cyanescens TaxID=181874 RepID=A0A409VH95_9AGAR|nr:hypothetical protein CVT24_011806 [Panaeolus cyanescens]
MSKSQTSSVPRHITYPIRSLFTITEAEERSICSSTSSAHYTDCESDEDDSTVFESESEDYGQPIASSLMHNIRTSVASETSEEIHQADLLADKLNYLSFVKLEGVVAQRKRFGDEVKLINPLPRRSAPKPSTPTFTDKALPPPPPISSSNPQDLHYWKVVAETSQRRCEQLEKTIESHTVKTKNLVSEYERKVLQLKEQLLAASSSFQAILKERDELREQLRGAGTSGGHVEIKPGGSVSMIENPLHCLDDNILPVNASTLKTHNAHLSHQLQHNQSPFTQASKSENEELKARLVDALASRNNLQEELNHSRQLFVNSQRRIQYLTEATYHRIDLEADRELPTPPKPQPQTEIPSPPNPAAVQAVRALNDYIGQSSSNVAGWLEQTPVDAFVGQERAKRVLGDRLTGMLERRKSRLLKGENSLLLRVVLDVFLVHWSSSIINGCYPRPKKLYDHLQATAGSIPTSGSSSSIDSKLAFSDDGIFALIASIRSDHSPVDLNTWLHDIYADFSLIMSTIGLRFKPKHASSLISVLQTIIDKSYELRFALAEREKCGYLETITISPDTEFLSSCMSDIYRSSKVDSMLENSIPQGSIVLGTCSIGLQQCPPVLRGQLKGSRTSFYAGKVIMKPGVALRSSMK